MLNEQIAIVAVAALFIFSALGWGDVVARITRQPQMRLVQDLAARFVLGCAALFLVFLALAFFGRLHRLEAGIVLAVGLLASTVGLYDLFTRIGSAFVSVKNWDSIDRVLLIALIALTLLQAVFGFTPLVFYDTQAYHFFVPSQFLLSGRFSPTPWNVYANSPLTMQFVTGMSLSLDGSGQTTKLIFTLIGCLLAMGVYELLRPAGRRPALLAALLVLSYPEFWIMQTLGVIDLAIAALILFGAIWAREAMNRRALSFAMLAGVAFGMAAGSRYQAIILLAWVFVVVAAEALLEKDKPSVAWISKWAVVVVGLAFVLVLPWLVRNNVNLKNPVFPLMESVFGNGGEWSPAQTKLMNAEVLGPSILEIPLSQKLLAPIRALMDPSANGLLGISLVGALIGLLAIRQKEIRITSLLGLGGLIAWGLLRPTGGVPLMRFNALSLVLLLAATGAVLGSEWIGQRRGTGIASVLAVGSLIIAGFHVHDIIPAVPSLVDWRMQEAMHRASVPSWESFDYINANLDKDHDRIFLLGETRGFWVKIPAIVPSAFNGEQLRQLFGGNSDPSQWMERFRQFGVTHVLVTPGEVERLQKTYGYLPLEAAQEEKLLRWLRGTTKIFDDKRGNYVLQLN